MTRNGRYSNRKHAGCLWDFFSFNTRTEHTAPTAESQYVTRARISQTGNLTQQTREILHAAPRAAHAAQAATLSASAPTRAAPARRHKAVCACEAPAGRVSVSVLPQHRRRRRVLIQPCLR